jgi:hypothetical protein
MVVWRGSIMEKDLKMVSRSDEGTSTVLLDDLGETKFRQEVMNVGKVGVVISLTSV